MAKSDEAFAANYKFAHLYLRTITPAQQEAEHRATWQAAIAWKQAEDLAAVAAVLAITDNGGGTPDFGQGWDAACYTIERRIKGEE